MPPVIRSEKSITFSLTTPRRPIAAASGPLPFVRAAAKAEKGRAHCEGAKLYLDLTGGEVLGQEVLGGLAEISELGGSHGGKNLGNGKGDQSVYLTLEPEEESKRGGKEYGVRERSRDRARCVQ